MRGIGDIFLDSLLDVVGENGLVASLSFTNSFRLPLKGNALDYCFSSDTPSTSGPLPKLLLRKGAKRSGHPTCSFVAIGRRSSEMLDEHNELSSSYRPIEWLVNNGGKFLNVGINESSPGFTSVHLVQEHLGLTKMFWGKYGVMYEKNGKKVLFQRRDLGGCSMGFNKFYTAYRKSGKLQEANIGKAASMLILARDSYDIEKGIIEKNPRFPLCDNKLCFQCRAMWKFNKRDILPFFMKYFFQKLMK